METERVIWGSVTKTDSAAVAIELNGFIFKISIFESSVSLCLCFFPNNPNLSQVLFKYMTSTFGFFSGKTCMNAHRQECEDTERSTLTTDHHFLFA